MRQYPGARWPLAALLALVAIHCGDSTSSPTPQPTPTPQIETWFLAPVLCANCPGLTDVTVDRTTTPAQARLSVGQLTSIRAVAKVGCGTEEPGLLQITRWDVSDPNVVKVEPSSDESAIVTALATGTSTVTAQRRLPDGTLSLGGLRDSFRADPPCPAQPELVLDVVP